MNRWQAAGLIVVLGAAGAAGFGYLNYRQGMNQAQAAWQEIEQSRQPAPALYDPAMVAGLPEIAQRYFNHAIAPGTPLQTRVELTMHGTFLLGSKENYQTYAMQAKQILAPPSGLVWLPSMRSGVMHISGSDVLVNGTAWTRFWINSLVPVANTSTSPDVVRSARFRSAVEAVLAPAAFLPHNGVTWVQTGPDQAQITVGSGDDAIVLDMVLASDGAVREVVGQRWTNANPEQTFRFQPFGGTMEDEATFGGFTIPSLVKVGNFYGTEDYLPFFQAEILSARYS